MTAEIHFVQGGEAPVLVGSGSGTLACECGNALVGGFQAEQFLGIGIRCFRCRSVTNTLILPAGKVPPASLIVAEPSLVSRDDTVTVPVGVAMVGRAEIDRLGRLFRPVTPASSVYQVSAALLDQAVAAFEHHVGGELPVVQADALRPFAGLRDHALGWAVRHLRGRVGNESWACMEDAPTANAVTLVTGFLHFVATWSHHPLFPATVATAGDRGFSLHGLALFAAAHSLTMMGNRIGFQQPTGYPGRLEEFDLATSPTELVRVHLDVFNRFEFPFGRKWDHAALREAVRDEVAEAHGRINPRNPGMLLLSPGSALPGYDEALIEAVKAAVQAGGRKNRGLMAVAPIVLRLQALQDPHSVRFGYGLFPVPNRHYRGGGSEAVGG